MTDAQIQIPFVGGPDESTDPRQLPPGRVISVTNAVYDADGSYQPRLGSVRLASAGVSGTSAPSTLMRVTSYGNELLAVDQAGGEANLWTFNQQGALWTLRDWLPGYGVTRKPLLNSTTSFQSWGEATGSGYRVLAWLDTFDGQVRGAIYDLATGALISGPTILANNINGPANVSCGIVGTVAVVLWATTAAISAASIQLSPLAASWTSTPGINDANYTGSKIYGSAFMSTRFAIAYQNGAGASNLRMVLFDNTITSQANVAGTAGTIGAGAPQAIAGKGQTGNTLWWVFINGSVNGNVFAVDPGTLAAVGGPFTFSKAANLSPVVFDQLAVECNGGNARTCAVIGEMSAVGGSGGCTYAFYNTSGIIGSPKGIGQTFLASAPFATNGQNGALLVLFRVFQTFGLGAASTSYLLYDLSPNGSLSANPQLLAIVGPGLAQSNFNSGMILPQFQVRSATQYECVVPIVRAAGGRLGIDLVTLDTAAGYQYSSAHLGKERYFGGHYYDGQRVVETGFTTAPQMQLNSLAPGGNTFQYATTFARIDSQGNLEESAPSTFLTTANSAANCNVVVNCLHTTNKQRVNDAGQAPTNPVYILVYRTANLANGDTTLYRVTKEPFPAANENLWTAANVVINDTLSDLALTDGTHPALYTVGGELAHNAPETFTHLCAHKNRIWGIGADQRTVWCSQTYSDSLLPAWNAVATFSVDDTDEPLAALGSLYDKLILLTRTRCYVVYGDGPSPAGTGSDLSQPQQVPQVAGCVEPRSVVQTPLGLMWLSLRGFELLKPDLSIEWIGRPVSVSSKTYPVCTSAVLCEDSQTVRFSMVAQESFPPGGGVLGVVLVYDYRRERWTTHNISRGGTQAGAQGAPVQCAVWHPTLGYVLGYNDTNTPTNPPIVSRESTTADGATAYQDLSLYPPPLSVQMAWVKAADLQGWQRVRRVRLLSQYYSAHDLACTVDYDFGRVTGEAHNFSGATITGFQAAGVEQVRITPGSGKSQAIRLTFTVSPWANTPGRGAALTGVSFEVKKKAGGYKNLGNAQKS